MMRHCPTVAEITRRAPPLNRAAAVLSVALTVTAVPPCFALARPFLSVGNAAWIYDPRQGPGHAGPMEAGHFAQRLGDYNRTAGWAERLSALYVYAGDMEMYCPGKQPRRCGKSNFHLYYGSGRNTGRPARNRSVDAYARSRKHVAGLSGTTIVPVIDGAMSAGGQLKGFNRLSREQAQTYADLVAHTVCADPAAAGIQFDLEPFDVSARNGQYYFYRRIGRDFSSEETGCVDATYPRGRFFSIFTSSRHIRPGTASAKHVKEILNVAGNGYLIDSLYDLTGTPAGTRTPLKQYRRFVRTETRHMRRWADQLSISYQFAIPAAASAHEYAACRGTGCRYVSSSNVTQLAYVKAATNAVDTAGARNDERFLGIAVWAWSPTVSYGGMQFSPPRPPTSVIRYLQGRL